MFGWCVVATAEVGFSIVVCRLPFDLCHLPFVARGSWLMAVSSCSPFASLRA